MVLNRFIYSVQKSFLKWRKKIVIEKKEHFVASLDARQLNVFNIVQSALNTYQDSVCYKYDSTFVIERDMSFTNHSDINSLLLISIEVYANACRVAITQKTSYGVKDIEASYINDHAPLVFEQMVYECLKRKHRDFIEKRNKIIV